MSTLLATIKATYLEARKAKAGTVGALSALVGEIGTEEKSFVPARPITDAEVTKKVQKFIKNAREALDMMKDGTSEKVVAEREKLHAEIALYEGFLPRQMTSDEVATVVRERKAMGENKGLIMKHLSTTFAGKYDGKMAAGIVDAVLKE